MKSYREEIGDLLAPHVPLPPETIADSIATPPSRSQGDFAFPCFLLAKALRKPPGAIAAELAEKVRAPGSFSRVEAAGGYLNFFVHRPSFARRVLTRVLSEDTAYGGNGAGTGKTVVIDFSSPNLGKELAFHHLRGTMLGNALSRIYRACGYRVERVNHLGDWGTSYGKLIVMFRREGHPDSDEALARISIEELNRLYKSFQDAAAVDPGLEEGARAAFQRLEAGDPGYLRLWHAFRETTLAELRRLYAILGVEFDHFTGESHFVDKIPEVIDLLDRRALTSNSEGALIVDLEAYGMPPLLLRKSDGSTLYATRDLAAAIHRKRAYGFHRCLYVVDNGQSLHFRQIFKTLELMGFDWAASLEHVPFGLVLTRTEEGKWEKGKTRAGQASLLREVLDRARARLLEIIEEKNPDLAGKEAAAGKIAVGALVFNDLKNRRQNDVRFDWDKVLSFEGDTGPYVQNAHVRLCSILRKAPSASLVRSVDGAEELDFARLGDGPAADLIYLLGHFPDRVAGALEANDPCGIGQYCLELAEATHGFLHACRVLGSEAEKERLLLVDCARMVLRNAQDMIGVPPIESM